MSGPFDGKKFTIAPAGGKEIPDFVDLDDAFAGTAVAARHNVLTSTARQHLKRMNQAYYMLRENSHQSASRR